MLNAMLSSLIRQGTLTVRYPDATVQRYQGAPGPEAAMEIRTPRTVRRMAFDPGLAFGEGYMDGEIIPVGCTLYDLLDVLVLNLCEAGGTHPAERVMEWWRRAKRRLDQFNPAPRARGTSAHHYDLDRRLFSLFLDRDLQYSCAYFPTGQESLDEAQVLKKRHIAAKLKLDRPDLEVLEIGCGWGGMALTLARDWGARVTGITLSTEQLEAARARRRSGGPRRPRAFRIAGLPRPGPGRSTGSSRSACSSMSASTTTVASSAWCGRSLKEDGVALVHAIGRSDGPGATNPVAGQVHLPRRLLPGAVGGAAGGREVRPLGHRHRDPAAALRADHLRTGADASPATAMRSRALYDERFCRMFEFYLVGCEAGLPPHGPHELADAACCVAWTPHRSRATTYGRRRAWRLSARVGS